MRNYNAKNFCLYWPDKISALLEQRLWPALFFLFLFFFSASAQTAITTYTDEAAYKAALSSYSQIAESFEDTAWDSVRTTISGANSVPGITHQELTWQNRFYPDGGVTTSEGGGDVHQGNWLFYASPHGGYGVSGLDCTVPGACGDGFIVSSSGARTLYGIGGWFTGASGPEIQFVLDGRLINGAGGKADNAWQFFAVIDSSGFSKAEIRDSSGTLDDQNLLWADDFTIAVSGGNSGNNAPLAHAGADQSIITGSTAILDGSDSSDMDADALEYVWSFISVPPGSNASLSNPGAVKTSFIVDLPGDYVARLIVNDGQVDSAPDTITVSTENSAPVADAGLDQSVFVWDTVILDASGSGDIDGDGLEYFWSFSSIPAGSAVSLSNQTSVRPYFVVDLPGNYVLQLIVTDGVLDSAPNRVIISTENSAPMADAGLDQNVLVGDTVSLDGGGSNDIDADSLNYFWSLTSAPAGSHSTLSASLAASSSFIADQPGTYVLQLIVNDGLLDSAADTVVINVSAVVIGNDLITRFIQRLYQNILGRAADTAGLDYWTNEIQTNSATWVALGFFSSAEYFNLGLNDDAFINILYRTLFDREADISGYNHWLNYLGQGALREMLLYEFFLSQEFKDLAARFGVLAFSDKDHAVFQIKSFVQRFYLLVLDRQAEADGFNYWTGQLTSGTLAGGELARSFFLSSEFTNRSLDDYEYIQIVYQTLFDRAADVDGEDYWLNQMASGLSRLEVLNGFLTSQEFFRLSGRFGITP